MEGGRALGRDQWINDWSDRSDWNKGSIHQAFSKWKSIEQIYVKLTLVRVFFESDQAESGFL